MPLSPHLLLAKLHRNDPITPSMVTTIARHAAELGKNVCDDYGTLNNTMIRYEALIRKRWLKKTIAQRREVLLRACPNMPEAHRPDCLEMISNLKEALSPANKPMLPSPACIWPYINLEDLTRPKSLLIFLNARGRAAPFTFARTEAVFISPLAEMSKRGPEPELTNYLLYLSADPDPLKYRSTINVEKTLEECDEDEDSWSYCMRPNLQVLYIQEGIMHFLVACCKHILHDVQEKYYTSVDFPRLRAYIGSILTNAKDHLWALREDPSYLADTVLEYSEHRIEMTPGKLNHIDPYVDTTEHLNDAVRELITEAYQMFCIWEELHAILEQLGLTSKREVEFGKFYHMLDNIDSLVRTDETAKPLLSPKVSRLITQLSLATECVVQTHYGRVRHRRKVLKKKQSIVTMKTSRAMRTAEANVDSFWSWVDTFFEQKTGVAYRAMGRNAPRDTYYGSRETGIRASAISRIYHQRELQLAIDTEHATAQQYLRGNDAPYNQLIEATISPYEENYQSLFRTVTTYNAHEDTYLKDAHENKRLVEDDGVMQLVYKLRHISLSSILKKLEAKRGIPQADLREAPRRAALQEPFVRLDIAYNRWTSIHGGPIVAKSMNSEQALHVCVKELEWQIVAYIETQDLDFEKKDVDIYKEKAMDEIHRLIDHPFDVLKKVVQDNLSSFVQSLAMVDSEFAQGALNKGPKEILMQPGPEMGNVREPRAKRGCFDSLSSKDQDGNDGMG
ncbi:hypothetical protein CC86DRAFT_384433 [Ophiobolus disseminans]|uniref:Uncharacterized protein n=1 Tax=Ophiobolus disseminans TaxID=1469910 RepID=A0A6A6ZTX9_9PLEO|nr:hypothetical protein CC86DRAFT_384433 [Ophiobolus disseminans]